MKHPLVERIAMLELSDQRFRCWRIGVEDAKIALETHKSCIIVLVHKLSHLIVCVRVLNVRGNRFCGICKSLDVDL